ncbi:AbrB family transcriptional regulator [Mameliella sediminis]|uniref:AbrB family transcriptional regulator n=1 Tax=Mameliella sediminis TaxID=2836866 RepID=UPI001C47902A|nr:AbrB family transcriptional regulator [Mameliella sediminis]MBV7395488.1 AbrB family transcriptional regulator [Mameliella sediminis]
MKAIPETYRGFATALVPAALGGAVWEISGLPLGWLMGAALLTGVFAIRGRQVKLPAALYCPGLAIIGASVGLVITPVVAAQIVAWVPVMIGSAVLGIGAAALFAPVLARRGGISSSTAFFSLLPGGVIEMASIGETHGADSTVIAALHAVRVALVVGLLPLALFFFLPAGEGAFSGVAVLPLGQFVLVLLTGLFGGWLGDRAGLPASWLLGAVIAVGLLTSTGAVAGAMPPPLLASAQVLVGMSLGARFTRQRLANVPRALVAGMPVLLAIMALMALAAALASLLVPQALATLVLCFSIGGMAEMVLTAKALNQNIALVAAFQALRGVTVNTLAATVWRRLSHRFPNSDNSKG